MLHGRAPAPLPQRRPSMRRSASRCRGRAAPPPGQRAAAPRRSRRPLRGTSSEQSPGSSAGTSRSNAPPRHPARCPASATRCTAIALEPRRRLVVIPVGHVPHDLLGDDLAVVVALRKHPGHYRPAVQGTGDSQTPHCRRRTLHFGLLMAYFGRRYELGEVIGQGGFGVVYRAHDDHLGREVALKLFREAGAVHQAVYEARMLTALEGPHVLRVLNADIYQDVPFTATQIAPLRSAEDQVRGQGTSVPAAIRWTRHLLLGLDSCHRLNLIHRDVKPSNLFLQNEHLAQLGDFGVAHIGNDAGVVPAQGDPRIRAPRVWATNSGTARSDVLRQESRSTTCCRAVTPLMVRRLRSPTRSPPASTTTCATSRRMFPSRSHSASVQRWRPTRTTASRPQKRCIPLSDNFPTQREWKRVPTHDGHHAVLGGRRDQRRTITPHVCDSRGRRVRGRYPPHDLDRASRDGAREDRAHSCAASGRLAPRPYLTRVGAAAADCPTPSAAALPLRTRQVPCRRP